MKKLLLTGLLTMTMLGMLAQQVARDKVVQEIGTYTTCPYCPGAAWGAEDLIANGCEVAVIEYHHGGSDPFSNPTSEARISYYGITGYPTAFFDGVISYVGGSSTTSLYTTYLPLYNQRIIIPCDFTIEVYGENSGLTYDVSLLIENVNNNTSSNLIAHLSLTESEIVYSWLGGNELNYVSRMMAPDHLGTAIDFTSGNVQQVDLQFTIDPTWVTTHCELVAFVQDNVTKEIMQATKVDLDNLQPFQATAQFSCSDTLPCVTTTVDFYDNSMGQVISWDWTFTGGTPPTSTAQNPTVTYNSLGSYDVRLIVSDGTVTDTLTKVSMIEVITTPVQPNTPAGPEDPCEDETGLGYTTDAVTHATAYAWEVLPANAGTLTGNGTSATLDLASGFLGDYTVKVRADNNCGQGTWSLELLATVYHVPIQYTLSDGGGYCEGEPGIELTLDGSETGIDYELFLDDVATGEILPGTGSALNFGYQPGTGIYSCDAYTGYCSNIMIGNAYVYVIYPPPQAATPAGPEEVCANGDDTDYTTEGATQATSYVWTISPPGAGTITGTTTEATIDWDESYSGVALVAVKGINDCGEGIFSDDLEVTSYEPPATEISGDIQVCNNQAGVLYSTPDNAGSSYTWDITGGTISSGAGTHEIQVTWGSPGTGTLVVTEENEHGCEKTTEAYEVTIDDCTGIDEILAGGFKIFPNPVDQTAHFEFTLNDAAKITVTVFNNIGQMIYQSQEWYDAGKQSFSINMNSFPEGIYTVQLISEDGRKTTAKFTKVR